jgi:hypothetical protein
MPPKESKESKSSILKEKGVSNNPDHRKISDKLDEKYFNRHPVQRAFVHGVYHGATSVAKAAVGNKEGAKAEWNRAKQQFSRVRPPTPPQKN